MSITTPVSNTGINTSFTGPAPGTAILPPNASKAQIDQFIQQNYGYMAWALAVPELKNILESVIGPNGVTVDQDTLNGMIRNTQWYQGATQAMRQWEQLQGEDPETAQAQLDKQKAAITKEATLTGLNLDDKTLNGMALQAISYGWSTDEMDQALQAEAMKQTFAGTAEGVADRGYMNENQSINPVPANAAPTYGAAWNGPMRQITGDPFNGGTMGYYYDQVMKIAASYLVTVDPSTVTKMAIGLATNQLNPASVNGTMQSLALGKFPTLANVIQSGITPSQYFAPIQQDIAKTLEIPPDQINFSDPKWGAVLQYTDPQTKQIRPMTDSEAINWARQQPEWMNTQQAGQQAAATVKQLTADFGVAKY